MLSTVPLPLLLLASGSALLGLGLLAYVLRAVLRSRGLRQLAAYFGHSFEDARDRPDAKLLTLFSLTAAVLVCFANGLVRHYWPPDYIWISTLGFIAAGYGFSAFENRAKIQAESAVAAAALTGQAPAEAASATTTTTTTLTPVE